MSPSCAAPACANIDHVARSPATGRVNADASFESRRSAERVVSLIYCPEVPIGTRYELAHRDSDGARRSLYAGILDSLAPSLNLAKIRYRGARLGANEVVLVLPHGATSF